MREKFYRYLTILAGILGPWALGLGARLVAAGYFLFFPARAAVGMRFYAALYPGRGRLYHLVCTWRQFHNFTSVFMDRFLLQSDHEIRYTFQGREHLLRALQQKRGGIILMSHMGNWEIAAHLLRRSIPQLRLMLYMGQRAKDEIERLQKEDLQANGIRIVAVDRDGGSPFDLVEGAAFLKSGGFVSMTGDRMWRREQRAVPVQLFGRRAHLPEAPHVLALISGTPLYIFFAAGTGPGQYHFSLSAPIHVHATARADRQAAIERSAQRYADLIERQLHQNPFEWYHFETFLGPPLSR